jgi:peroxiredoxin
MSNETLTKMSHIVFIVTCITLVSLATFKVWNEHTTAPRLNTGGMNPAADPIPKGTRAGQIENVSYDSATLTVALVLNTQCRFCTASVPFYKRLAQLRRQGKVQVVALSAEPQDVLKAYLSQHELNVDTVARLKGAEIQSPATPAIVLIGKDGIVYRSWLGQLNADQEEVVMKQVRAAAG